MKRKKQFEVEIGTDDLITPGGLEFAGMALEKTAFRHEADALLAGESVKEIRTSGCLASIIGLLSQGKTAYDDVREMRENPDFHSMALGNEQIPASETLRQRLDEIGGAFDRSEIAQNTVIGWTYKGFNGYSPIYAYLGEYMINCEFRNGEQHSQKGATAFFEQTIRCARQVTDAPLLFRLDSGHDAGDNVRLFAKTEGADYIIKRNLRSGTPERWLEIAQNADGVEISTPREGKTVYVGSVYGTGLGQVHIEGIENERIVFEVTVRHYKKDGQMLLIPEIEVSAWRTSLGAADSEIIELYKQHAVCEQYHSELKTDIGLERFPSGKRATNAAVLKLAMIAFIILRLIGRVSLLVGKGKQRRKVSRIRLITVMQRFIFIAARVVRHAKRIFLKLGRRDYWRFDFISIHQYFASI